MDNELFYMLSFCHCSTNRGFWSYTTRLPRLVVPDAEERSRWGCNYTGLGSGVKQGGRNDTGQTGNQSTRNGACLIWKSTIGICRTIDEKGIPPEVVSPEKSMVTKQLAPMPEGSLDDILRILFHNLRCSIFPVLSNIVQQVMMDQPRKKVMAYH